MMVATFVAVYETLREAGTLIPHDFPGLTVEAGQAFNLTSFALSLLLVFRTNESYNRWLEARKAWSAILLRSRDLVRQVSTVKRINYDLLCSVSRFPSGFSQQWICAGVFLVLRG